jgi:radical SAM-linked protein
LSLSAGDYGCLNPLLEDFFKRYDAEKISVGLPSLRTETLTPRLASEIRRVRKSGFTIAPEAGSARMRRVINKGNDEQDLLNAVRATFGAGWDLIKMYFMIGLPTETDVDVAAIAELAKHALDVGRAMNRRARVTASVSTFVPKPMTPFQWCRQIGVEETRDKQSLLLRAFKGSRVEFKRHDAPQTLIEGVLSRGDRRVGRAILLRHERGGRFDGWTEQFSLDAWRQAMADAGLDIAWYLRERDGGEALPWDHIDSLMPKSFLWEDYQAGLAETFVDDCALAEKPRCYDCGVCDHKIVKNRIYREEAYNVSLPVVAAEPVPHAYATSDPAPAPSSSSRRMVARIRYGKIGRGALFGHLDTMTVMLRAMKRAGIPCGMSDGFHPKPKASFSPALALGVESRAEIVEVELERPMRALEIYERLARETLDGFPIYDVQVVPAPTPPLEKIIDSVDYVFTFPEPKELAVRVALFHAASTFEFVRRKEDREKRFDLKRAISGMEAVSDVEARVAIVNRLDGMPKPSEILSAVFGVSESEQTGVDIMKERVTFIRESRREERREARF